MPKMSSLVGEDFDCPLQLRRVVVQDPESQSVLGNP